MATLATLLGMTPAPVERCRALELGCAGGGNLIPMALCLPDSQFVGIDYAASQIESGQAAAEALGLRNIQFTHMDVLDIGPDLGQFDYIIAHGLYSWVPQPVQEKLLDVCAQNLAPQGVAYVSYNAFPGWHALGAFRQMMLYHTRNVQEPHMRAAQARELIEFLAESVPQDDGSFGMLAAYNGLIKTERERWQTSAESYLLHDELEDINEPLYFYQFAERAARHGLQYLCEAEFSRVFPTNFSPQVSERLLKLAHNLVEMEQYMDFVRNETFRRTLLVHAKVLPHRSIKVERVPALCASSRAEPVSDKVDIHSISVEQFRGANKATLSTDHPATKAAMLHLREVWPAVLPFGALLEAAYERLDVPSARQQRVVDTQVMSANLLKAFSYSDKLMELRSFAPRFATRAGERPVASPWARYMADTGLQVTNLRHERVDLAEADRYLLRQLDGRHDRAALLSSLTKAMADGALVLQVGEQEVRDPQQAQSVLAQELEHKLDGLARAALLVG
jgi:methyltransferase-like protein